MFAQDNLETLPTMKSINDLAVFVPIPSKVLYQPSSKLSYLPNPNVSGKSIRAFPDATVVVLFYEQTPYTDGGRYVCFLDGHIAYVSAKAWETLKTKAGIK